MGISRVATFACMFLQVVWDHAFLETPFLPPLKYSGVDNT